MDAVNMPQMQVCLPDGVDCYDARVVPKISSVNLEEVSTLGGDVLEITGGGLAGTDSVEVDGQPCRVF